MYSNIRTVYPSKTHVTTHPDADDNTVSCSDNNLENGIRKLSEDSVLLIRWFLNKMKANPEKKSGYVEDGKTKVEDIT